jgi:hypothetical protein
MSRRQARHSTALTDHELMLLALFRSIEPEQRRAIQRLVYEYARTTPGVAAVPR